MPPRRLSFPPARLRACRCAHPGNKTSGAKRKIRLRSNSAPERNMSSPCGRMRCSPLKPVPKATALLPLLALAALCSSGAAAPPRAATAPPVAATPPMGWNSWDSYGTTIDEAQVRATARVMADKLKRYGWRYVVIDEGWYEGAPAPGSKVPRLTMDAYGRYLPNPARFPSAVNGAG